MLKISLNDTLSKLWQRDTPKKSTAWFLFVLFMLIMLVDRLVTLLYFSFIYTDIDQMVMWNGAFEYSKGIFHEPFFYGQAYNYMVESFLAVPLLWVGIPMYKALPITTSIISLLPFVTLAFLFIKRRLHFWAYLCLALPVILPLHYNFLTSLSRGFVQAHLFVPLLFLPFLNPKAKPNVTLLFLTSGACFIANPSSLLIVLPIVLYVYTYHARSLSFYLKSLLVLPFLYIDYLAKNFYKIHPERVLHEMAGMTLDSQTFISSFKNPDLFKSLFPFVADFGALYFFVLVSLAIFSLSKSLPKQLLVISSILFLLLATLAVPKIQEQIPNTGVFFSPSRLYLFLPVLLILVLYLVFRNFTFKNLSFFVILFLSLLAFITKNFGINKVVHQTISQTTFPVAKNQDLVARSNALHATATEYDIDIIVHANSSGWHYIFDSYAFNPLTQQGEKPKTISVNINGDRRSWLYSQSFQRKKVLLHGLAVDQSLLQEFDYEIIRKDQILISLNNRSISYLFDRLKLKFGNSDF